MRELKFRAWEDYEEPKSGIEGIRLNDMISGRHIVEIDFTKVEEAEKAVEKLKAWKRLKDKKIFIWLDYFDYRSQDGAFRVEFKDNLSSDELDQVNDDLDLIFGGEE